MLTLHDYQKKARATKIYPEKFDVIYPSLGLAGEAGELANKVKKALRDNDGEFTEDRIKQISDEIGDCLWYCANIAADLGLNLQGIAEKNISKLASRQERGKLGGSGDER